jgi:hypothetical protein
MNHSLRLTAITLLLAAPKLSAATLIVGPGHYSTIQQAIDAAAAGDQILVTNGVYGAITVDIPVTVQSMNGPYFTVISSSVADSANVLLSNGASLTGFTVSYAGTNGGGVGGLGDVMGSSTNGFLTNCVITGANEPGPNGADGIGGGVAGCTLYNCVLTGNWASYGGGGAAFCTLYNCTVVSNSAQGWGGGTYECTLYNSIVCSNTAYCPDVYGGGGCSPSGPDVRFVDFAHGNFRLQSNSPCINAGNNAFVATTKDLDGRPRIAGGTVDLGAYEFQPGVSGAFIGWLQYYGLRTSGSADYTDSDHDGMNNWQEWVCGTCPTNSLSVLRLLSATPGGANVTVTWQSVAGVNYCLWRSANPQPPFALVATNITGQQGTTTYADTNATGSGPFFYRVGVPCP